MAPPFRFVQKQSTGSRGMPRTSDDAAVKEENDSRRQLIRSAVPEAHQVPEPLHLTAQLDGVEAQCAMMATTEGDEPPAKENESPEEMDQCVTERSCLVSDSTSERVPPRDVRLQQVQPIFVNMLRAPPVDELTTTMQFDGAKELCSLRCVFCSVALAALVAALLAASVLTTVLTTKPDATVLGYSLPFRGPSSEPEPADNKSNATLKRIPLHLPPTVRRVLAANGFEAKVNRSSAQGLLQGVAQDIEEEVRARLMKEWASNGGLIDVPVRDPGPQCKQGSHNCEWQVVSTVSVNVRQQPSFTSEILTMKASGSIVVGRAENEAWLRLAGEAGFIAFEMGGSKLLKQRTDIWYEKIVHGACTDVGRRPILDARSCEVAAMTLGIAFVGPFDEPVRVLIDSADNESMMKGESATEVARRMEGALQETHGASLVEVNASLLTENASSVERDGSLVSDGNASSTSVSWDDGSRPEGCYIDATGTLRINLQPENIGNGARWDMQPICATKAYPSTHTTTSTTSTTHTTTRSYGEPSFMCFSYMRQWTVEEQLVKQQMWKGAGIFACDQTVVVSSARVHLGKNQYGEDVFTWANPPPSNAMGNLAVPGTTTNSWLNTLTFMIAIDTILHDSAGRVWSTDFFVKADPDAILLPDRLRDHARYHVGAPVYFLNCGHNGAGVLYGAVEIYSKQAMGLYKNGHDRCMNSLNWRGWGEDSFFASCMAMLGAQAVSDFTLVGDSRCNDAPCTDTSRAAFHPFKDVGSWVYCWRQATNIWD